jgi:hypothetical protein
MELSSTKEHLRRFDCYYPSIQRYVFAFGERIGLVAPEDHRLLPAAMIVAAAILSEFAATCREHAIMGYVLLLPVYWGRYSVGAEFDLLKASASALGLSVIDGREAFIGRLIRAPHVLHHAKNHYTRESGSWVSALVAKALTPKFAGPNDGVASAESACCILLINPVWHHPTGLTTYA